MAAIAHPIPPVADQRRAVPGGRHHRRRAEDRRAEGAAGAGVDAGLRRRALSHRDALRHPRPRERRPQHGHLSRRAESAGPRGVPHGGARGDRRRRLSALAEIPRAQGEDADRHRGRRRADRDVHRAAEACHRCRRDGGGGRRGRRGDPHDALPHRRPRRAGRCRDRGRGPDRLRRARARGAVRREQRLCRARSLQHADRGHGDHPQEEAGVRPDHQPGDAERVRASSRRSPTSRCSWRT